MSLYTDRGSALFPKPPRPARSTAAPPTQVGRALEQLGVEHIGAYSPHSPWRDGRPSRRPLPEADRNWCSGRCRTGCRRNSSSPPFTDNQGGQRLHPRTSTCRSTTPASPSIRPARARPSRPFRASISTRSCASRRSARSARTIASPTGMLKLQLQKSPMRPHFVKARVKVHVYPDGSHAVFHGPRCIGRYDKNGALKDSHDEKRAA